MTRRLGTSTLFPYTTLLRSIGSRPDVIERDGTSRSSPGIHGRQEGSAILVIDPEPEPHTAEHVPLERGVSILMHGDRVPRCRVPTIVRIAPVAQVSVRVAV